MKNKSGITLIALIITIIVMLILVAVSVQILIKSDLIGTAESAGAAYKTAHEEEQNLKEVTINGKKYDSIEDYIAKKESKPTIKAGEKATANSEYSDGTDTAVIPAGFTVSGAATEKTIDGGLVIYLIDDKTKEEIAAINWEEDLDTLKTTYDQFVWIPIKNTTDANAQDINDMYICQGKTADNGVCTITVENGVAKCTNTNHSSIVEGTETNKNTLMAGRLYATSYGENFEKAYTETYTSGSGLREPDTVSDYDGDSDYLGYLSSILEPDAVEKEYTSEAKFKEKLQEEYNDVVKSVYENEGFYVGRYETSNITETDGTAVQVIEGTTNKINDINWYYMYGQQKDYAKNKGLTVGSTMIQGAAYDQVMKFVDGTNLGNGVIYDVTTDVEARHTGDLAATGSNTADFVKNIYDLEGNIRTWTTEAGETYARTDRGGNYGNRDSSSTRYGYYPDRKKYRRR